MSNPPPTGQFWRAFAAVTILPMNGSQKAVLRCLIDHANPKNGLCYPSEALIAAETDIPMRTVERAVANLLRTPYLSRKRRNQSSNRYNINFGALLKGWDDYKARGAAYRVAGQETDTATVMEPSPNTKNRPSQLQAISTTVSVLSEKRRSWSPCRGAASGVDELQTCGASGLEAV